MFIFSDHLIIESNITINIKKGTTYIIKYDAIIIKKAMINETHSILLSLKKITVYLSNIIPYIFNFIKKEILNI